MIFEWINTITMSYKNLCQNINENLQRTRKSKTKTNTQVYNVPNF